MALIPPAFLNMVVSVGVPQGGGDTRWVASGFFYGHHVRAEGDQSLYASYLVTNRHVVQGKHHVDLRVNPSGTDKAIPARLSLVDDDGKPRWLSPTDPDIDVAAVPLGLKGLLDQGIEVDFFRSDGHVAFRSDAIAKGVSEGDGLFVLGYPAGVVERERSFPVVRQGSIARIRDWLAGASKDFLADVTVYPGNSGGPVIIRPEVTSIVGTPSVRQADLIGVVSAYVPYRDVAISQQTGRPRVTFEENTGLAVVVPIDYVDELVRADIAADEAAGRSPSPG